MPVESDELIMTFNIQTGHQTFYSQMRSIPSSNRLPYGVPSVEVGIDDPDVTRYRYAYAKLVVFVVCGNVENGFLIIIAWQSLAKKHFRLCGRIQEEIIIEIYELF